MAFDVEGAKKAGYSDDEIRQFIMSMPETAEAKKAGYTDAEIHQHFGIAPSEGLTAGRAAQVTGGAVAPIAAAAGAGAMLGGPAGAALAAGGLGLADLAATGYNLAGHPLSRAAVRTPSEIVRGYLTPQSWTPQTPAEEMLAAGAEGAAGAFTGAGAANVLARRAAPRVVQNVLTTMGERPLVQAGAGAGAAAAPIAAREAGVESAPGQIGASLVGGLVGARGAAGLARTGEALGAAAKRDINTLLGQGIPSTEALKERAKKSFEIADQSGVVYKPTALKNFVEQAKKDLPGFDVSFDEPVNKIFNKLEDLSDKTPTITELHRVRRLIGDKLRTSENKDIRRMGGELTNMLDDFVTNPKNATIGPQMAGNAEQGADALLSGIKDYRMMSKSSEIEHLIERAGLNKGTPADMLQSQFASLAKNPKRMRRFTSDEQALIRNFAEGKAGSKILDIMSLAAPKAGLMPLAAMAEAGLGAQGYLQEDPSKMAAAAILAGGGASAKAMRNVLAKRAAANIAAATRGAPVAMPFNVNNMSLVAPILAQSANAMAR